MDTLQGARTSHGGQPAAEERVKMRRKRRRDDDAFTLPLELELDRIITLQAAENVSSLSVDAIKRNHRNKLVQLSARRLGMRLRDALMMKSARA